MSNARKASCTRSMYEPCRSADRRERNARGTSQTAAPTDTSVTHAARVKRQTNTTPYLLKDGETQNQLLDGDGAVARAQSIDGVEVQPQRLRCCRRPNHAVDISCTRATHVAYRPPVIARNHGETVSPSNALELWVRQCVDPLHLDTEVLVQATGVVGTDQWHARVLEAAHNHDKATGITTATAETEHEIGRRRARSTHTARASR
jgi:hypothetical protein